jgi:two-component system OmpR family response regulator
VRVLVVEDEPYLTGALKKSLHEEGYAVDVAFDGEEGLYKAKAWDYDAIVLDVMLPKRNGWEILEELRRSKGTPVLMLTARDTVQDRVRGLDSGADDYLVKPFDLEELLARLRALIRRASGTPHPVIELGDVVVDTASRTVRKGGEEIVLTAREYALVEMLALHRGKVVTRTMLYEHLCDENQDSLSKVVEVHVSNVRKKLGKDLITTRRGHGYLIDV